MARNVGLDGVVDHFTLIGSELDLLRNKSGASRLAFAVLLKFVLWRGRFPRVLQELPDDAVEHLARQVRVPAGELAAFNVGGRTAKRHRTEIRAYTGFRECSVAEAQTLTSWLAEHVAGVERRQDRVREELHGRCRAQLIEPPTPDRVSEIVRSALHQSEQALLALIAARVDDAAIARLLAFISVNDDDVEQENLLALIKAAPGNVSLERDSFGRLYRAVWAPRRRPRRGGVGVPDDDRLTRGGLRKTCARRRATTRDCCGRRYCFCRFYVKKLIGRGRVSGPGGAAGAGARRVGRGSA